jgi:acyl-CoA thioesterase-1
VKSLLLYSLYSGWMFFAAVGMFLSAVIAPRRAAGFLALLAIPLAILAAPPIPLLLAIPALMAVLAFLFAGVRATRALRAAAVAACLLVAAVELPYHVRRPRIVRPSSVFVIGDSLASGGFGEAAPWPSVLSREIHLPVTNLALPSDNAAMALENQVPRLPVPGSGTECVIIEIGGNDMLEETPAQLFARALDGVVAKASASGRRSVVMLELPLLPGRWRYGAIQRDIAAKHGLVLVPKRILARALAGAGHTSDGVHLTQRGHDALARDLAAWLRWPN